MVCQILHGLEISFTNGKMRRDGWSRNKFEENHQELLQDSNSPCNLILIILFDIPL